MARSLHYPLSLHDGGSALHSRPVAQARSSAPRNPCLTVPAGGSTPFGRPGGGAHARASCASMSVTSSCGVVVGA
ncbi:hypothetical protein CJ010_07750 [Azoarcus sp. DD4]|nr:hypothetical protein CJ010_07750 [Azoarcus sp. DD4]